MIHTHLMTKPKPDQHPMYTNFKTHITEEETQNKDNSLMLPKKKRGGGVKSLLLGARMEKILGSHSNLLECK